MATALSDFYQPLRLLLGDNPVATTFQYEDGQLAAAVRSIIDMGLAPGCLTLTAPRDAVAADADARVLTPDEFGFLAVNGALLLAGGNMHQPESYRTEVISVRQSAGARRDAMHQLQMLKQRLESEGDLCGSGRAAAGALFDGQSALIGYFWHHAEEYYLGSWTGTATPTTTTNTASVISQTYEDITSGHGISNGSGVRHDGSVWLAATGTDAAIGVLFGNRVYLAPGVITATAHGFAVAIYFRDPVTGAATTDDAGGTRQVLFQVIDANRVVLLAQIGDLR